VERTGVQEGLSVGSENKGGAVNHMHEEKEGEKRQETATVNAGKGTKIKCRRTLLRGKARIRYRRQPSLEDMRTKWPPYMHNGSLIPTE
jgi:hypothetical protein